MEYCKHEKSIISKCEDCEKEQEESKSASVTGYVAELKQAANCALWLLSQPELKHLIDSDWGDPIAIKEMLEKAGCVPSCAASAT